MKKHYLSFLFSFLVIIPLFSQYIVPRNDFSIGLAGCQMGSPHNLCSPRLGYDFSGNVAYALWQGNSSSTTFNALNYHTGTVNYSIVYKGLGSGTVQPMDIHFDVQGNMYLLCYTAETIDLNPSPLPADTFIVNKGGNGSVQTNFFVKYSPTGKFIYGRRLGLKSGVSFSIGTNGDIYIASNFKGTVNADLNGGSVMKTSAGLSDILVCHYNSALVLLAATQLGSTANDSVSFIENDAAGNMYISGNFSSSVNDFDPGAGVISLPNSGSLDMYVAKYSSTGALKWAKKIGGTASDNVVNMRMNEKGQLNMISRFSSSNVNFALTGTATNLSAANLGNQDVAYAAYDTSGAIIRLNHVGVPAGLMLTGYSLNPRFELHCCGNITGSNIDVDPGTGVLPFTSNTNGLGTDLFFSRFDSLGTLKIVQHLSDQTYTNNTSYSYSYEIVALGESFLIDGNLQGSINMNLGSGAPANIGGTTTGCFSAGSGEDYLVKYCAGLFPSPGTISGKSPVCPGDTVVYSVAQSPDADLYTWGLPAGWSGSSTGNSITSIAGSTGGSITLSVQSTCDTVNLNRVITVNTAPTVP